MPPAAAPAKKVSWLTFASSDVDRSQTRRFFRYTWFDDGIIIHQSICCVSSPNQKPTLPFQLLFVDPQIASISTVNALIFCFLFCRLTPSLLLPPPPPASPPAPLLPSPLLALPQPSPLLPKSKRSWTTENVAHSFSLWTFSRFALLLLLLYLRFGLGGYLLESWQPTVTFWKPSSPPFHLIIFYLNFLSYGISSNVSVILPIHFIEVVASWEVDTHQHLNLCENSTSGRAS